MTHVQKVIEEFAEKMAEKTRHHIGYPYNLSFDFTDLRALQDFSINNLGDPFIESNYSVHSREFEIEVLDWFAELWDIGHLPGMERSYWGYVTNCGTEGNLQGIYLGRENHPDAILYTSESSHYSVFKAARMYRMECVRVKSTPTGHMDLVDLEHKVSQHTDRDAIVNVNIGTTMTGAVDDVDGVLRVLSSLYSGDKGRYYVHCDGALMGVLLPFLNPLQVDQKVISFTKGIDSVSVSGHKFMGTPVPCGVLITRKEHINAFATDVDYIGSRDATIMGSRNGHAPLYMWYTLHTKGIDTLAREAVQCVRDAEYLRNRLLEGGVSDVLLNAFSNTVVMPLPPMDVVKKWQLACKDNVCHVVVMPNVDRVKIDAFLLDYFGTHDTS